MARAGGEWHHFARLKVLRSSIVAIAVPMHLFSAAEGEVLVVISRMPLSRDVSRGQQAGFSLSEAKSRAPLLK